MKFGVLALDYDGTIANQGRTDPAVLAALKKARSREIVVVLVTGRILADLRQVASDLSVFDAIVAENGAVLALRNAPERVLGRPPPTELLEELRRRGVMFSVGECVLDADASFADAILAAVRQLELPLVLLFNRNRVMLLPQGISKATGLREVLDTLRLSVHNCLAVGDAENDFQLLDAAEIGVAAGWGSKSLRSIADVVVPGSGPADLAPFLESILERTRLPPNRVDRRHIALGRLPDGPALKVPVRGRLILIAGDPRSGKSWVTGLFCEQLILQGYSVCVIDPEGDYTPLEALPRVTRFAGEEPPPRLSDVTRALRYPGSSIVIDLSHINQGEKAAYLRELLSTVAQLRRDTGQPHWIVVDEAHYFLHDREVEQRVDLEFGGYVLVTYRVSYLHRDVLREVDSIVVTQLTDPHEVHELTSMYGQPGEEAEWKSMLQQLKVDEAALLPRVDAVVRRLQRFTVAQRLTPHVRHRSKYITVPIEAHHAFVFTDNGAVVGTPVRTLKDFVAALRGAPAASIAEHARRSDFSRWLREVFGDRVLATGIARVEQAYRRGGVQDLVGSLIAPIRARYDFSETP